MTKGWAKGVSCRAQYSIQKKRSPLTVANEFHPTRPRSSQEVDLAISVVIALTPASVSR
jgi:hypothetical protein